MSVTASESGLLWRGYFPGPLRRDTAGVGVIAWGRVVPFVIDANARVHLVGRVRIRSIGREDQVIELPQCRGVSGAEEEWMLDRETADHPALLNRSPSDASGVAPLRGALGMGFFDPGVSSPSLLNPRLLTSSPPG